MYAVHLSPYRIGLPCSTPLRGIFEPLTTTLDQAELEAFAAAE